MSNSIAGDAFLTRKGISGAFRLISFLSCGLEIFESEFLIFSFFEIIIKNDYVILVVFSIIVIRFYSIHRNNMVIFNLSCVVSCILINEHCDGDWVSLFNHFFDPNKEIFSMICRCVSLIIPFNSSFYLLMTFEVIFPNQIFKLLKSPCFIFCVEVYMKWGSNRSYVILRKVLTIHKSCNYCWCFYNILFGNLKPPQYPLFVSHCNLFCKGSCQENFLGSAEFAQHVRSIKIKKIRNRISIE